MAQDSYDAYGMQEQQQGLGIGSTIKDALNPVSIAGYKFMMPGTYDPVKGFKMPFGGTLTRAWHGVGVLKGGPSEIFSWGTAKRAGAGIWSGMHAEGRYLLGGELEAYQNYKIFKSSVSKGLTSQGIQGKLARQIAKSSAYDVASSRIGSESVENIIRKSVSSRMQSRNISTITSPYLTPHSWQKNVDFVDKSLGNIGTNLGKAGVAGIRAGRALTWGLKAARLGATAMSVWTVGEIALMIGKPIGQAMMTGLNSALQMAVSPYQTEMGGNLAMSYLTHGAATERQRGLEAISRSGLNARAALGQEARNTY